MSFTVTPLLGEQFLVSGTDQAGTTGQAVLRSPAWAAVLLARKQQELDVKFDERVRDFFAPLTEMMEEFEQDEKDLFELTHVVLSEGADAKPTEVIHLDPSGIVLNLIDRGRYDELVWVNGELFVVA
jgi:hypothetical protein